MLKRVLEPEVMDTPEEAVDYDAMDHTEVNRVFVDDFLAALSVGQALPDALNVLDAGTGTAQIPIELASRRTLAAGLVITATDLAEEMLKVAAENVAAAGMSDAIQLERVDCKAMPFGDASFDAVMSNSIVHHIPEPVAVFREMWRVLKPGGLLFVRDLLRPDDEATLNGLVETYAGDENEHQQKMFRESLHAALSIDEVTSILDQLDIPGDELRQTTDRHWTLAARK